MKEFQESLLNLLQGLQVHERCQASRFLEVPLRKSGKLVSYLLALSCKGIISVSFQKEGFLVLLDTPHTEIIPYEYEEFALLQRKRWVKIGWMQIKLLNPVVDFSIEEGILNYAFKLKYPGWFKRQYTFNSVNLLTGEVSLSNLKSTEYIPPFSWRD